MLYLIGLGLNIKGITKEGLEIAKRCKKVYLENYTVELPYTTEDVSDLVGKKVFLADRKFIESLEIVDESERTDIALLIYGSPLTATTHIALLEEAKKSEIPTKVIYSSSVFDAVAETGLQLYKFGKIASMPKWQKNFEPDSFIEIIQHNLSMKAHSLILVDIGLRFRDALKELEDAMKKNNLEIGNIVLCQALGTDRQRIVYGKFSEVWSLRGVATPFCFIIPSKLHFMEAEVLENFKY
ncbi:MAG: diphthine synthase [Candidatus Pacearchaeota archaeon]|jgi:diphthine synthase